MDFLEANPDVPVSMHENFLGFVDTVEDFRRVAAVPGPEVFEVSKPDFIRAVRKFGGDVRLETLIRREHAFPVRADQRSLLKDSNA